MNSTLGRTIVSQFRALSPIHGSGSPVPPNATPFAGNAFPQDRNYYCCGRTVHCARRKKQKRRQVSHFAQWNHRCVKWLLGLELSPTYVNQLISLSIQCVCLAPSKGRAIYQEGSCQTLFRRFRTIWTMLRSCLT